MKLPKMNIPHIQQNTLRDLLLFSLSGKKMNRREWAEQTNTCLTTVGKVAKALLDAGLVTEQIQTLFRSGRKTGILRTNRDCRFLVVAIHGKRCKLTVFDGWGERREETWLSYEEDLTEQENRLLWKATVKRWMDHLENTHFLVGSAMTVPRGELLDGEKRKFFADWEVDCLLSHEEGIEEMIRGCFEEETVYFLSLAAEIRPVLYIQGKETEGKPPLTAHDASRVEQLRGVVGQWNAMTQVFPDPMLILWAADASVAEEELIKKKLLSGGDGRILYVPDFEIKSALYCLKRKMAERIASEKAK